MMNFKMKKQDSVLMPSGNVEHTFWRLFCIRGKFGKRQ